MKYWLIALPLLLLLGCKATIDTKALVENPQQKSAALTQKESNSHSETAQETLQVQGYEPQRQKLMEYLSQEDTVVEEEHPGFFTVFADFYPWLDAVQVWGEGSKEEALCLLYQIGSKADRDGLLPWILMLDAGAAVDFILAGTGPRSKNFQLADIDGDANEEILVHIDNGGNGGVGHYYSMLFRWDGKKISEIYSSISKPGKIATTFTLAYENEFIYRIANQQTGFDGSYCALGENSFFDSNGTPNKKRDRAALPCHEDFFDFHLADINTDGTHEIIIGEYLPLGEYPLLRHSGDYAFLLSALRYHPATDSFQEIASDVLFRPSSWEAQEEYLSN